MSDSTANLRRAVFGPDFPMPDKYIAAVLAYKGEPLHVREHIRQIRLRAEQKMRVALAKEARDLQLTGERD